MDQQVRNDNKEIMSRNKSMTKSRWKLNDKTFRDEQNAKAKANRERAAKHAALMAREPEVEEAVAE